MSLLKTRSSTCKDLDGRGRSLLLSRGEQQTRAGCCKLGASSSLFLLFLRLLKCREASLPPFHSCLQEKESHRRLGKANDLPARIIVNKPHQRRLVLSRRASHRQLSSDAVLNPTALHVSSYLGQSFSVLVSSTVVQSVVASRGRQAERASEVPCYQHLAWFRLITL
ncbi:hypothetical protein E2C01_074737 [Portunus trituberculatus]|uniref:Uncharacterized protein n=1 Tax=Portunus trituberculatus TaxID=210409 RepID=A0A5B7IF26_PORTR|nr:hypothetical protein [Portunus trituberculatus]